MAEETKDTEVKGNEEFGTAPVPEGFANPPIDDLMKHADSKYALAIFAAKRARQINSYSPSSTRACCRTSARWSNTRTRRSLCRSLSARSTRACWRRLWARMI